MVDVSDECRERALPPEVYSFVYSKDLEMSWDVVSHYLCAGQLIMEITTTASSLGIKIGHSNQPS